LYMDLTRYLVGDDVFISYSRSDGLAYALAIATSLSAYRCYVDQLESVPGVQIPRLVLRRLQRSTVFVLVGTNAAVQSKAVAQELDLFLLTRRPVIPISFAHEVETSLLGQLLIGLPLSEEPIESAATGVPSPAVLARVNASVNYTRHSVRMRRLMRGAVLSIAAVIVLSAAYIVSKNYIAARREECRLAKSGLDSTLESKEFAQTWPDGWKQVRADEEAEVVARCGKDGRWNP
jgi:hypothetical protein